MDFTKKKKTKKKKENKRSFLTKRVYFAIESPETYGYIQTRMDKKKKKGRVNLPQSPCSPRKPRDLIVLDWKVKNRTKKKREGEKKLGREQ